jgi:hypothetical protein
MPRLLNITTYAANGLNGELGQFAAVVVDELSALSCIDSGLNQELILVANFRRNLIQ